MELIFVKYAMMEDYFVIFNDFFDDFEKFEI